MCGHVVTFQMSLVVGAVWRHLKNCKIAEKKLADIERIVFERRHDEACVALQKTRKQNCYSAW